VFVHLNPVDTATAIEMNPLDHSLTFDLALTDYHNPEAKIFQYRIKGLFDEWVTLNSLHTLKLYRLAPGKYTLEIKATDSRGAPAVNTLEYHIQVDQLFYRTAWFYLLLFVLASGLLWAFFYLRLQNVKRVQKIREQLAADLHDEVGSLLTRITMTSDNLQYSRNTEPERASKLQKIASLSRTAASSMSDILWAIDARNDYTGNLADRMREHAEEMLSPRDVHPEFDFVVNQRMSISSELRQQLYLLYKEAINNIVKHSEATDVRISYHHNEQGLRLSIINNGVVEKERTSSKGQGLRNIQMRAKRIHATALIKAEGDRFTVVVENG
jgi:two-component sensor histidine kinase